MDDLSQILKIAGTSPSPVNSASLNWVLGLSCLLASHPPSQDWASLCTGYGSRGQGGTSMPSSGDLPVPPVLFGDCVLSKASLS